jgi:hypothetical protein
MTNRKEIFEEYEKKISLIMESYIKGDISNIEYSDEIDKLEEWFHDQIPDGEKNE